MLTLPSIITSSIPVIGTVGGLAALADGAVRMQLEQAVRGDPSIVGRAAAPVGDRPSG